MDMRTANLIEAGKAIRHRLYRKHGRLNDPGRHLNPSHRQPASAAPRGAFPDPFAAFDAAVNGKTVYVKGYTRADGRKVTGYYRRPAAKWIGEVRPLYIGTVTDAGSAHAPLLVG